MNGIKVTSSGAYDAPFIADIIVDNSRTRRISSPTIITRTMKSTSPLWPAPWPPSSAPLVGRKLSTPCTGPHRRSVTVAGPPSSPSPFPSSAGRRSASIPGAPAPPTAGLASRNRSRSASTPAGPVTLLPVTQAWPTGRPVTQAWPASRPSSAAYFAFQEHLRRVYDTGDVMRFDDRPVARRPPSAHYCAVIDDMRRYESVKRITHSVYQTRNRLADDQGRRTGLSTQSLIVHHANSASEKAVNDPLNFVNMST